MRRMERQETRERRTQEKAVRKAERKAAAEAAGASEAPEDLENPKEAAAGGAAVEAQEGASSGQGDHQADHQESSEGKPLRTRVRNARSESNQKEPYSSGEGHDGPLEVPVVADIDFSALRSRKQQPGGHPDDSSATPAEGEEAPSGGGPEASSAAASGAEEGNEAPVGGSAPDDAAEGGGEPAGGDDEAPGDNKAAAPGGKQKVSKQQAARQQAAQQEFFSNNRNVSVGEEGQQVVVDASGNVVEPDESGLMTVVGDDGKKQTLMYDVDGNLVPALVDAAGEPVLNEAGKPMSGWVLDSEGRVAYTADDKTINVALQEGKPVALVTGADGRPKFQALETSDAGRGLPGPRLPPEVAEVGASVRQVMTSDGRQSFAIKTTRTINGREVEVDVVTAEDGTETVIMKDADGKSVALVVDESGDVVVGDDGKPMTTEVPETAKVVVDHDAPSGTAPHVTDGGGASPGQSQEEAAKIETREIEGVEGPVEVVVRDDGQQIALIKDEDGNEVSVLLDSDGKIMKGDDGKPVVTALPPEIQHQRSSAAAASAADDGGGREQQSAEARRASAISKASRSSTASAGPRATRTSMSPRKAESSRLRSTATEIRSL